MTNISKKKNYHSARIKLDWLLKAVIELNACQCQCLGHQGSVFFFPGTGIWILENEKCWCELLIRYFFSTASGVMKVCTTFGRSLRLQEDLGSRTQSVDQRKNVAVSVRPECFLLRMLVWRQGADTGRSMIDWQSLAGRLRPSLLILLCIAYVRFRVKKIQVEDACIIESTYAHPVKQAGTSNCRSSHVESMIYIH